MALTPVRLVQGVQLGSAVSSLFTCPSGVNSVVKRAVFTNQDASNNHTITVYIVKQGASATAAYCVINTQAIAPLGTYIAPELAGMVLAPGDSIQALADSGAQVTVTISGFEQA